VFAQGFIPRKIEVLRGVSATVQAGEVYGFLGPNGAGKTTTIKILMNLLKPSGGSAQIDGYNVLDTRARRSVGFMPEQPYFYAYLTGEEFLDYCGQLFGLSASERGEKITTLLDKVGLKDDGGKRLQKYSRGMLQRIGIAQALINDPGTLILDEPLSGLDPVGRREMLNIIFEQKEQGKTIFFSSHILSDAQSVCDRVGILNKGVLIAEGTISEILAKEYSPVQVEIEFFTENENLHDSLSTYGKIFRLREKMFRISLSENSRINEVLEKLLKTGVKIESVNHRRLSLEELFLKKIT